MQLLKGLVLGLLVNRGFGQTDPLPTDNGAVDTVAEPVATDAPDPSAVEPSAPPPEGQCNESHLKILNPPRCHRL
jgi:hypothetical protein